MKIETRFLGILISLLLSLGVVVAQAQHQKEVDSLLNLLDTAMIDADSSSMLHVTYTLAKIYDDREAFDSAVIYYNRGIRLAEITKDDTTMARMKNNLGNIYLAWGNYQRALDLYLGSLSICNTIGDSIGISMALNNIGVIYSDWGETDISFDYYSRSLEVDSLIGDIEGQSKTLNNIAILFDETGNSERALRYYFRALGLAALGEDHYMIALISGNIGGYYLEIEDFEKAANYYFKALEEFKLTRSVISQAETYINIGDLYKAKKEFSAALEFYTLGLEIVVPKRLNGAIMNAYESMYQVYVEKGNYREAFSYFSQLHNLRDSIFSVEASTQLATLTNAYEIQQKDQEMELQKTRMEQQSERIKRQVIGILSLAAAILIIAIFTALLIRQYRLRMKAWKQLLSQHEEILKNRQELILAKEKAEESDRLKTTFLVNVSHELRTPMNGIMGFTDLLQRGSGTVEQNKQYLSYIASSSRQLLKVLNDIIDISSIETGQMKLEPEICIPDKVFKDLLNYFEKEKRDSNKDKIEIKYLAVSDAADHQCTADKKRLAQVIFNLVNNALIFTSEGSIEFGYEITNNSMIHIFVKDTGIGIERSNFEMIFERFRQIDDSTTRQHGGSGLGLAICKELVNLMNGRIYLESEIDKGSTFHVEVPYLPHG